MVSEMFKFVQFKERAKSHEKLANMLKMKIFVAFFEANAWHGKRG